MFLIVFSTSFKPIKIEYHFYNLKHCYLIFGHSSSIFLIFESIDFKLCILYICIEVDWLSWNLMLIIMIIWYYFHLSVGLYFRNHASKCQWNAVILSICFIYYFVWVDPRCPQIMTSPWIYVMVVLLHIHGKIPWTSHTTAINLLRWYLPLRTTIIIILYLPNIMILLIHNIF